jgi:hypothetical protein
MADKNKLEQMLEHLINEDTAKAEELFHEYVVEKSREIYEGLIDAELEEATDEDEEEVDEAAHNDEEDEVKEAADEEDDEEVKEASEDDEDMEEGFEDIAIEGDDDEMPNMGGDPTDDLEGEMGPEEGEEGDLADKEPAELFQDLDAIVDELQAKFDAMGGEMSGEEEMKDALEPELATVREYVEKVSDGHGAEKKGKAEASGANTKSVVDNMKNDMGGTTANLLRADVEPESASTKGGLLNPSAKDMNTGNINVPGGKAGKAFSKKEPGHGAEKAGAKEDADNKQSLFRGRR